MMRALRALAITGLFAAATASAVPVIPGASGSGIETPAGRGGTVYRVTNLNESGTGSLKACIDASGPRVCIFEVSGTIRLTSDLVIRNPNITIAGQTAPSPGIMIRGAGLVIWASDVLVQHIRIRVGDDPDGPPGYLRDALSAGTSTRVSNIIIDHVSLAWGIDETASTYWSWDNITFLNTIFGGALNDSIHETDAAERAGTKGCPCEAHGFGPLFQLVPDSHPATLTMIGNLLVHQVARNPVSLAPRFAFINNVVYNAQEINLNLTAASAPTVNSVVGNVFISGPNSWNSYAPILLGEYQDPLPSGSRVYLADNLGIGTKTTSSSLSDPWSLVSFKEGQRSDYEAGSPPVWPTSFTARRTANNEVLNSVLANVGARPVDRDSADRRIIDEVRNRNGEIINCVSPDGSARCSKNAGGWPTLAQNTRRLTLPASPNTVGSDGYTNLERWLHGMAAEVEGRSAKPLPPANARAE